MEICNAITFVTTKFTVVSPSPETGCQRRTVHAVVIGDCGRLESGPNPTRGDDWRLDLYVMLARATRVEDQLLMRAPPSSLLWGLPRSLRTQLDKLAARTAKCWHRAAQFVAQLGFGEFLH